MNKILNIVKSKSFIISALVTMALIQVVLVAKQPELEVIDGEVAEIDE